MNFVADLLWLILPTVRRSSVGNFVERFFIRILFQVYATAAILKKSTLKGTTSHGI
jgi:hypothetical protein